MDMICKLICGHPLKEQVKINNQFQGEVLATVTRAGVAESLHLGHLIALNADGSTFITKGSPELYFFPRSAIKAIQASAMLKAGLKLSKDELAISCASHSGSDQHINLVTKMLTSRDIPLSALKNAPDKPLGEKERSAWADKAPSQLAQNCSGKHAGMLITCQQNDWPMDDYLSIDHPLQQAIKNEQAQKFQFKFFLLGL